MAAPFSRSMRALAEDDAGRAWVGLISATLIVGAWVTWLCVAQVSVYARAEAGRVEVEQAAHPVESSVEGRVRVTRLALDAPVKAGEVLVELDTTELELELEERRAKLSGFAAQAAPLQSQIAAQERVVGELRRSSKARLEEARSRQREAEEAAAFATGEARRAALLREEGLTSGESLARAAADERMRRAAADAQAMSVARIASDLRIREDEMNAEIAKLRRELGAIEAERSAEAAAIRSLQHQIELTRIRAPVAGRLGEIAALQVGAVIRNGDRVGSVVPRGGLKVVADFKPAIAVGRIRPGQHARVRLEGFPWTQYGTVTAEVASVASELREGRLRVELRVVEPPPIPLQHGLPGAVEIQIEQVSPATLVLRAAGRALQGDEETRP